MDTFYEFLLQRSNAIENHIKSEIAPLDSGTLYGKKKKWSAIEAIDHSNKV